MTLFWRSRLARWSGKSIAPSKPLRLGEGILELRPTIESVEAFAGLGLDVFASNGVAVSRREAGNGFALRVNAGRLLAGRDAEIGDDRRLAHAAGPFCYALTVVCT